MALNDLFILWNHASIKVIDVRRQIARRGEQVYSRDLPACAFLFSVRGSAHVLLGDVQYKMSRFHLLHGGKGLRFELLVADGEFEYYLIYYKAIIPLPCRPEIARLMERTSWFQLPYAYVPQQPLLLLDKADSLLSMWLGNGEDSLRKLRAKTAFHQFVCELFEQMHEQQEDGTKPDLVAKAKQYIHAHYAEPITLDHIAHALHYSVAYLTKQFKQRTGHSPIHYLIGVRVERAMYLLTHTDATLSEIASGVGYPDTSYFIRVFKKHAGVTPGQFKERVQNQEQSSDYPMMRLRSSLVPKPERSYNFSKNENHYHDREGERVQIGKRGTKGKMHKLMLGLALLLSACSGTGNVPTNGGAAVANSQQTAQQTAEAAASTAREATQQPIKQQWPRTYVDGTGKEVVIKKQPERIVVTHFGMMEYFFALETPPIASTLADRMLSSFETLKPYAKTASVKDIGEVTTPNLELMATLDPDMIVAFSGTHNDVYEDLNHISTVVMINNTEERSWSETLREYAKLIGKEQLAETYISNLEALMSETRQKLDAYKDKTVTFLRPAGDGTFYALDDNDVSYVFDQEKGLGLKSPGQYKLDGEVVSLEGITVLDPDYIFIVDHLDNQETSMAELSKSSVWKSLKAVKENHVYPLDVSVSTKGPLAVHYTTTQLLQSLTK